MHPFCHEQQPKCGGLPQSQGSPQDFGSACALVASPRVASAIPAMPLPNFFSAAFRVMDWARPFASSSNLSFITLSFCLSGRFIGSFVLTGHFVARAHVEIVGAKAARAIRVKENRFVIGR